MRGTGDDFRPESTGREFYAHKQLLSPGENDAELYEGYDGIVSSDESAEERNEIAEYMIARWRKWAAMR